MVGAVLVMAVPSTLSWSDGVAGGTAQVPEHLRECAEGFQYCKAAAALCGGCHGGAADMRHEGFSGVPVTDRIGGALVVNADTGLWEYTPGAQYIVEVGIRFKNGYDDPSMQPDARPAGFGAYSDGAFTFNASEGTLSVFPAGDDTVRITSGTFQHHGSRNDEYAYECPADPSAECRYGSAQDNEADHAGEAVSTYEGSHQRDWTLQWTAPGPQVAHAVALRLTVMVPDGDAIDSCVYKECNASRGYSDQSEWDWWTHLIEDTSDPSVPEAVVLCEAGYFESRKDCRQAALGSTSAPRGSGGNTTSGTGGETPVSGSGGAGAGGQGGADGAGVVDGSSGTTDASSGTQGGDPTPQIPGPAVGAAIVAVSLAVVGRRSDR